MVSKKDLVGLTLALSLSSGCASYKINTPNYTHPRENYVHYNQEQLNKINLAKSHPLYHLIPLSYNQLRWYDFPRKVSWAVLGNEEDGIFGEYWKTPVNYKINTCGFLQWTAYNPLHNFCFYTIGFVDEKEKKSWAVLNTDKGIFLEKDPNPPIGTKSNRALNLYLNNYRPFLSFSFPSFPGRKFDFYFGWRRGGAFGMRLWPFRKIGNNAR